MSTHLTHASIEKIRHPKTGRIEIKDSEQRSLYLRVSATGRKSFIVFGRCRGRAFRKVVGYYDRANPTCLSDARLAAQRLREDAVNGRAPDTPAVRTFADLARLYIEQECKKLARPRERAGIVERGLLPAWGDKLLTALDRSDLTVLTDAIKDKRPQAANRLHEVASRMLNWAHRRGHIKHDSPFRNMDRPAPTEARDRVLSDDEIRRLWRAWDGLETPYGVFFKILLATGQRRGEVAGMRWDEIDFEGGTWTLPAARTKASRQHIVPLSSLVRELLESLPRTSDHVFTGRRAGTHIGGFSDLQERADKAAGVSDYRLHDLRRSAATYMAEMGVPEMHISVVLNHKRKGVTAVYNRHEYLAEKAEALERWACRLRGLTEPSPDNLVQLGTWAG